MRRILIAVLLGYVILVIFNNQIVRYAPKVARFFIPPFFQYSKGITSGTVRPFKIGMTNSEINNAASHANLLAEPCDPIVRIANLEGPPSICYKYDRTGVYWDLWLRNDELVAISIYTSMNLTSD